MDDSLYFDEHHLQVRDMVRDFARNEVAPVARELDRTQEFPWENIKKMGELGLLGVPWDEAGRVGSFIGIKTVLTEFIAYLNLSAAKGELTPRTFVIATYALCGFANFASIAIQIGGISSLEEGIRPKLARLGLLALVGGTLAALMTGTVAGMLT